MLDENRLAFIIDPGDQAEAVSHHIEDGVNLLSDRHSISMRINSASLFQILPRGRFCNPIPRVQGSPEATVLFICLQKLLAADYVQALNPSIRRFFDFKPLSAPTIGYFANCEVVNQFGANVTCGKENALLKVRIREARMPLTRI
jgi:hypothetical protein